MSGLSFYSTCICYGRISVNVGFLLAGSNCTDRQPLKAIDIRHRHLRYDRSCESRLDWRGSQTLMILPQRNERHLAIFSPLQLRRHSGWPCPPSCQAFDKRLAQSLCLFYRRKRYPKLRYKTLPLVQLACWCSQRIQRVELELGNIGMKKKET